MSFLGEHYILRAWNFHSRFPVLIASLALLAGALISSNLVYAESFEIKNIRVAKNGYTTRIVFDTNNAPNYKLFTLNNPSRVVIDFQGAKLATAIDQSVFKDSLVQKLRHAQNTQNKLRVVLDLKQTTIPKSFLLPPHKNSSHRLVVDLKTGDKPVNKTAEALKRRNAPQTTPAKLAKVTPQKSTAAKKTVIKPEPIKQTAAKQVKSGPNTTNTQNKKLREFIVAIDPGHGGKDPGAIGYAGTREKDVVLQISNRLARLINAEPGMRAILIRSSDKFLTLRGRIKKAKDANADMFISVHADAVENRKVRGSSVYVLSKNGASSEAAKILAQSQNQSDVTIGGVNLDGKDEVFTKVMLDLSKTATIDASTELAKSVIKELSRLGKTRRHVEHAGFAVLKSLDIPSILVETAFISNVTEERKLRSPEHQQKLAASIFKGVKIYVAKNAPEDTILASRSALGKHTIKYGETLSGIAQRYRVSLESLRSANFLSSDKILVGQQLVIPEA